MTTNETASPSIEQQVAELMLEASAALRRGDELIQQSLDSYRQAGIALTEARDLCEWGSWGATLDAAGINRAAANRYIRLAHYWSEIPQAIVNGDIEYQGQGSGHRSGFVLAMKSISHLPKTRSSPPKRPLPEWVAAAKKMRADGVTTSEIADVLGLSKSVVQRGLSPDTRRKEQERKRRQHKAMRELERKEQRGEARRLAADSPNSELSKAYGLVRSLSTSLDRCITRAETQSSAGDLRAAADALVRIEAIIVSALREARIESAA